MTVWVNLLPWASRRAFEHRKQTRFWVGLWLVLVGGLTACQGLLEWDRRAAERELTVANAELAPLRQAQREAQQSQTAAAEIRRYLKTGQATEQSDAPLALLQIVADCCHNLNHKIQLASLRMDEATVVPGTAGEAPPRKQLHLAGTAEGNAQVTAFVNQLRDSRAFQWVELEASQAVTEQAQSRRSFQIRCQQ